MGLQSGPRPHGYVSILNINVDPLGLSVSLARARQSEMLGDNVGYNVSPLDTDKYPAIGRAGTYITDEKALTDVLGKNISGNVSATPQQIAVLERNLGLNPGSLQKGFKIRKITGVQDMSPRSPLSGAGGTNSQFLGGGQMSPGGGPEMVINSVPTVDGPGVSTIGHWSPP